MILLLGQEPDDNLTAAAAEEHFLIPQINFHVEPATNEYDH